MKNNKKQIDIEYIANLSRMELSVEETGKFSKQLSTILDYIEQLSTLDTSGVKPLSHVQDLSNVMHPDIVKESLSRQDVLKNAPSTQDGHFKVPKVI